MKRTIKDKIISFSRKVYYGVYERLMLRYIRKYKSVSKATGLITIITPTYNRCELLKERAIKSVLNQTYKNWEYIIIGDGCTDDTEDMIKLLDNPKIKFFNIPRRGPNHNYDNEQNWFVSGNHPRNFALKNCIFGEYIAMLDDDDIWHPEFLDVNVRAIKAFNVEFISSANKAIRYGQETINYGNKAQSYFYTQKVKKKIKGRNPIIGCHSSFFYKAYLKFFKYNKQCWRKKWNKVNDTDLSYRMFKSGIKMGFIKRPLVLIYPRPDEETIGLEAVQKKINVLEKMLADKGANDFEKEVKE